MLIQLDNLEISSNSTKFTQYDTELNTGYVSINNEIVLIDAVIRALETIKAYQVGAE